MGAIRIIEFAIVLVAGLTLGWLAGGVYADYVTAPAARAEGSKAERAAWENAQRQAEAEREAERHAAQVRIDAIERAFHQREAKRVAELAALEAAIEKETSRAQSLPHGAVCRPAVPRSLRDALDRVGRPAPRDDPTIAADPLR